MVRCIGKRNLFTIPTIKIQSFDFFFNGTTYPGALWELWNPEEAVSVK